jgi:hypothetical protein
MQKGQEAVVCRLEEVAGGLYVNPPARWFFLTGVLGVWCMKVWFSMGEAVPVVLEHVCGCKTRRHQNTQNTARW